MPQHVIGCLSVRVRVRVRVRVTVRVRVRVRVSVSVRVGVLGAYVERAAAKQPALHLQHTAAPATSAAAAATSFAAAATAASAALSIITASAALVSARLGAGSGLHLAQRACLLLGHHEADQAVLAEAVAALDGEAQVRGRQGAQRRGGHRALARVVLVGTLGELRCALRLVRVRGGVRVRVTLTVRVKVRVRV